MRRTAFVLYALALLVLAIAPARGEAEPQELVVTPSEGRTGTVVTITGIDFGSTVKERRVALKADLDPKKSFMIPLEIVRWEPGAVEVRIPKVRPDAGRTLHVVLVDRTGRTLARSKDAFLLTRPTEESPKN